ncbi:MAG: SufD family Fe-S cluster assembly protein [Thaumarchaeota archaeon]|nr:SufD family Fe-S cluster assembly protein [Nitrososphaerota archaeon]
MTEDQVVVMPRNVLFIEGDSKVNIVEQFVASQGCKNYLTNSITDILINDNAKLNYCKIQNESVQAYHVGFTRVLLQKNCPTCFEEPFSEFLDKPLRD